MRDNGATGERGDGGALMARPTATFLDEPAAQLAPEPVNWPFKVETLSEILGQEDEPLDVVIGDKGEGAILTRDGKGGIAAGTGLGKTNTALRLSRCLCEGSPFLGYPIPTPHTVLYLALEGSPRALHRRLRKIWAGADSDAIARFLFAHGTLNLADAGDFDRLDEWLYGMHPDVLIIDPLRDAHPWDENSSSEMAELTKLLDVIIRRHECAIIFCHHDRKRPPFTRQDTGTDRVRGSTALTGWLTFCLTIDREPGNIKDRFVFTWAKTRDAEELLPPLVVDFQRDTLDFAIVEGAAIGGKVSDDAILTAIFQNGGSMRGTALIQGFVHGAGASERTTRERLRALVNVGRLIQYMAPADMKTQAKSYRLPDEEQLEVDL
jgi:hypothetical protein